MEEKVFKKIYWNIGKYTKESLKKVEVGTRHSSPQFSIKFRDHVTKWHLCCFPNGDKIQTKTYIGMFLVSLNLTSSEYAVEFRLGLLGQGQLHRMSESNIHTGPYGQLLGKSRLISFGEFFQFGDRFIIDESITLICEITISNPKPLTLSITKTLIFDYEKAFNTEYLVDFKLKMNDGVVLNAHKLVLGIRSEVFKAMLTNDTKEVQEGAVTIPDFDSKTMREALRFMYCNKVENLNEIAHELVLAAEKYDLGELKVICVESIIRKLTAENAVKSLMISEGLSKAEKLFKESADFIISNYQIISKTEDWKALPKELMMKVVDQMWSKLEINNSIHL